MGALSGFFRVGERRVWCSLLGDDRTKPPLICIPGGPGAAHDYLQPLEALAASRSVVFYDPLGSGRSERTTRTDWTIGDFLVELQELVRVVDAPRYYLFAHSAAGFAAYPFAFSHPPGLAGLVLGSCYPRIPGYHVAMERRLASLQLGELARFRAAERDISLRDARYIEIAGMHIRDLFHSAAPASFLKGADGTTNIRAHRALKGGSVFYTTGLEHWDVTSRLGEIAVPVLITCGRYDFVSPEDCADMQRQIPRAELAVFEHSGHMPHVEETELYIARLVRFLDACD
jgi:proline iminopeptidase